MSNFSFLSYMLFKIIHFLNFNIVLFLSSHKIKETLSHKYNCWFSYKTSMYSVNCLSHIIIKIARIPFHLGRYLTDISAKSTIYQLAIAIIFSKTKAYSKEGKNIQDDKL